MLFSSTRNQNKTILVLPAVLQALKLLSPLHSNLFTCGGNTAQFIVTGAGIIFLSESVLAVFTEWSKSCMVMYYQPVILSLEAEWYSFSRTQNAALRITQTKDKRTVRLILLASASHHWGEGGKKKSKAHRSFSSPPTQYCFSHVSDEKHSPIIILYRLSTSHILTNSNAFSTH